MFALLSYISILSSYNTSDTPNLTSFTDLFQVPGDVRFLSLIYPPESNETASKIHETLQVPTTLNSFETPKMEEDEYRYPSSVILVLDENMPVDLILNQTIRNHETAYAVLCKSEESIEPKLQEFWAKRIISAFAIVIIDSQARLFGFEPTPGGIAVQKKKYINLVDLFDLHGTDVNVSVVNLAPAVILDPKNDETCDGVEGRIMVEVARRFNIKPHFAMPKDGVWWGWIHPKATGVVGEVMSGYSGFGFGILSITDIRTKVMDQLAGYNPMECVTWAVPKGAGPAAAPWVSMLVTEFSLDTWAAMAGSFAVFLASLAVERLRLGLTVFRIFASSIGSPVELPTKSSSRILMLTWVWTSFILAVAYTASMGSKLAVPPTNPDINTFSDLLASSLNVTGFYNTIRLMTREDPLIRALAERSHVTTATITEAFARLVEKRDIAYLRQGTTFRYNAIVDPDAQEDIHIMQDCALTYYSSINMAKWSPFYRGTQAVVARLFESGITAMWGAHLMPEFPELPPSAKALGLGHLLGAFAVLGVGVGFSTLAFLSEIMFDQIVVFVNWLHPHRKSKIRKINVGERRPD